MVRALTVRRWRRRKGRRGIEISAISILGAVLLVGALVGCGSSSGEATDAQPATAELREAKREGEAEAKERDRVAALQKQVHSIRRRLGGRRAARRQAAATVPATPVPTTSTSIANTVPERSFHSPSGNVSCEIFVEGATCTVASAGQTFVLEPGRSARIEAAAVLPPDLGEIVGYGSTVSIGAISCQVPPSDVRRGVSCIDSSDGHGFEASRVSSRQKEY